MEKMPYQPDLAVAVVAPTVGNVTSTNWQYGLPVLHGQQVVLRELRGSDAVSLHGLLTAEEVARFISPPPTTVEGFEKFIAWTLRQRTAGTYVCFAVTIRGYDTAIGIFQIRDLGQGFETAEWGFALGSAFWGTGVFYEGAQLALEFVFETLGVHRLEARAAVLNGRGTGALQKIGAVQEGILRHSLLRNGRYLDQALFALLDGDWRSMRGRTTAGSTVRVH
jgi:RimJ/RimL family protein N-acetyltransferase